MQNSVPAWLSVIVFAFVILAVLWWAESRVTAILTELRAVREDLDKLRALAEQDEAAVE